MVLCAEALSPNMVLDLFEQAHVFEWSLQISAKSDLTPDSEASGVRDGIRASETSP
jgi:hypothetical protein